MFFEGRKSQDSEVSLKRGGREGGKGFFRKHVR